MKGFNTQLDGQLYKARTLQVYNTCQDGLFPSSFEPCPSVVYLENLTALFKNYNSHVIHDNSEEHWSLRPQNLNHFLSEFDSTTVVDPIFAQESSLCHIEARPR